MIKIQRFSDPPTLFDNETTNEQAHAAAR